MRACTRAPYCYVLVHASHTLFNEHFCSPTNFRESLAKKLMCPSVVISSCCQAQPKVKPQLG